MTKRRSINGSAHPLIPVLIIGVVALAGCSAIAAPGAAETHPTAARAHATTETVTVTIAGGLDTNPVDSGRPVVLIAAALGVPTDVFRDAFSRVTPAGAGEQPTDAEAQANKQALLTTLAPYGVVNDRLDQVSNYYRYQGSAGESWPHTDAQAVATIENGVVVGIVVTDPGSGYSSAPTITLSNGQTATAILTYGTDFATNGSIASITLN
ncbi:MAG: hypothetical protein ABIR17_11775 [Pseudolysinimonas sp.]|uniref:hypothetical protein n=1 Tax=Pseudolysinimonas sp. TaxID=2680009 RepID=UPI003262FEA0